MKRIPQKKERSKAVPKKRSEKKRKKKSSWYCTWPDCGDAFSFLPLRFRFRVPPLPHVSFHPQRETKMERRRKDDRWAP